MNKELAKLLDDVIAMWLDRLEFIHEKGLDDEYFVWLQRKDKVQAKNSQGELPKLLEEHKK